MKLYDNKELKALVADVSREVVEALKDRLKKQGHVDRGRLLKSVTFTVDLEREAVVGNIKFLIYGQFVDQGVKAARIPFSGTGARSGKVSKYIQGLVGFFKRKGLTGREALGAAFATAYVHKREGMPTRRSRRFSNDDGKARRGFVGRTVEEMAPYISARLGKGAADKLYLTITANFKPFGIPQVLAI